MSKKFTLIGMLGLMAVLALSAFGSVNYQPVLRNSYSIADISLRASSLSALNSDPLSSDTNFRIAHTWNGIKIPAMDVTSYLAAPQESPYSNFRIAHTWNGIKIPAMDVTGFLAVKKFNSGH